MTYRSLLLLLTMTMASALIIPIGRAQETQNQAGVVIRYGDGHVTTACVRFSEPSISGIELLQRAGIPVIAQSVGMGSAVCKISSEGCDYPTEDCFCQCKGGNCAYWAYQRLRGDRWAYSPIGASASQVQPGDIDGWAWGAGNLQSGAAPPVIPLDQICSETSVDGPTAVAALPTSLPAATTAPTATSVPVPTSQVIPPTALSLATRTLMPTLMSTPTNIPPTPLPTRSAVALAPTIAPSAEPPSTIATIPVPTLTPTLIPTNASVSAPPTLLPTSTPAMPAASTGQDIGSYLLFGVLAVLLGGGIVLAIRRNR